MRSHFLASEELSRLVNRQNPVQVIRQFPQPNGGGIVGTSTAPLVISAAAIVALAWASAASIGSLLCAVHNRPVTVARAHGWDGERLNDCRHHARVACYFEQTQKAVSDTLEACNLRRRQPGL
jgi:hypothetical protein